MIATLIEAGAGSMRCVTVHEVAKALGMRYGSAYALLKRLEKRGLLSKKSIGRAAMFCGGIVEPLLNKKRYSKVKMLVKLAAVRGILRDILQREGCVSTYTLTKVLGVSRGYVRRLGMHLIEEGEVASMVIGNITIWCRSRAEAEALVERLRNTVHRIATANNFRYVTPSKILHAVKNDNEAYSLFSKFIKLSRIDEYFSAVALAFADGVLRLLYGEPAVRTSRKVVYIVSQPRAPLSIDVRDSIDKKTVSVIIPDGQPEDETQCEKMPLITVWLPHDLLRAIDEYAAELKTTRSAVVRQAISQMLEKMRKVVTTY